MAEEKKKLRRSQSDRVLAGVCGGLGAYFDIDPVVIRVIFVLLSVFGGSGVLAYIILWLVVPEEDAVVTPEEDADSGAG